MGAGSKQQLRLLSQQDLNAAVFDMYVGKEDKSAIVTAVKKTLDETRALLGKVASRELACTHNVRMRVGEVARVSYQPVA